MAQLLVLVEGQTEETFVRELIRPHLQDRGVYADVVIFATKRMASGGKFRGGASSWPQMRDDLRRILRASHLQAVTTMCDLYGLPSDVPGAAESRGLGPYERASRIETAIADEIGDDRLRPYIQVHEFESLVLANPEGFAARAGEPALQGRVATAVDQAGGPELVNDQPNTAPSKRIVGWWSDYAKTVDGPALVRDAGLDVVREQCPHFNEWLSWMEEL